MRLDRLRLVRPAPPSLLADGPTRTSSEGFQLESDAGHVRFPLNAGGPLDVLQSAEVVMPRLTQTE